jgi:hypothetical protein
MSKSNVTERNEEKEIGSLLMDLITPESCIEGQFSRISV